MLFEDKDYTGKLSHSLRVRYFDKKLVEESLMGVKMK